MEKHGKISVKGTDPKWMKVKSVTVDGVDVTNRCFEADDIEGYAICYKHDDAGKILQFGHSIPTETLKGEVKFVMD